MNPAILNREFQHPADGWYQIEAKGEHPNRAAGVVQVIDDEAAQSIVNRFNADAQAGKLRHGREMLIDHEHFSDQPDKETRAYGWLQELQNRADGIYGRIRWSKTGKEAVDGGDYRFFSTEYGPDNLKVLNDGKPARVRPLALAGLTLTNMNNNRGQRPITNRAAMNADETAETAPAPGVNITIQNGDFPGHPFRGNQFADGGGSGEHHEASRKAHEASKNASDGKSHAAAAKAHARAAKKHAAEGNDHAADYHEAMASYHAKRAAKAGVKNREEFPESFDLGISTNPHMKDTAKLLGLSEDAAPEAVAAAVLKLHNRASELEAQNQTLLGEQCDALMTQHGIKADETAKRDKLRPVLLSLKNREDRAAFLAECVAVAGQPAAKPQTQLRNRDTRAPGSAEPSKEADAAKVVRIQNRATELQKQFPSLTAASAFVQAQREVEAA